MENKEFAHFRKKLNRTQKQMAQLLGTSIKAVHSYEQGWRAIPAHVERQMFFLVSRTGENRKRKKSCWTLKKCPPELKKSVRPGSLSWVRSAGLLMEQFVTVIFTGTGKKR